MPPEKRQKAEITYEDVFGFRHDAFRSYMTGGKIASTPATSYEEFYTRMRYSQEPIVTYAAGWALADLCTQNNPRVAYTSLSETLAEVAQTWDAAYDLNDAKYKAAIEGNNGERARDHFTLGLQIRFAQAHLPIFHAIAARTSTGETRQELLDQAYDNLMGHAAWLLDNRRFAVAYDKVVRGAITETLVSALVLRAKEEDFLATPSSIRQQVHPVKHRRSDIVTHDFSNGEYVKAPIQVKTRGDYGKQGDHTPTLLITAYPYLSFVDSTEPEDTLEYLVKEHQGEDHVPAEKGVEVDQMTGWLMTKVYNNRTPKTKFRAPREFGVQYPPLRVSGPPEVRAIIDDDRGVLILGGTEEDSTLHTSQETSDEQPGIIFVGDEGAQRLHTFNERESSTEATQTDNRDR